MPVFSKLFQTHDQLIVITGPMFAGKTTKILELYSGYNPSETLVFNHTFDNRYDGENEVVSTHNKDTIPCIKVKTAYDIKRECYDKIDNTGMKIKNVIIDECQFFKDIDMVVGTLFDTLPDIENIVCAGLDLDAKGGVFNTAFQNLIDSCDVLHKLEARCHICDAPAQYTSCLVNNNLGEDNVLVGSSETYQPSCGEHFAC
jgi:thymidine kinase